MPLLSLVELRRKFLDRNPKALLLRSLDTGAYTDRYRRGRELAGADERDIFPRLPARSVLTAVTGGCGNPGCTNRRPVTLPWSNPVHSYVFEGQVVCSRACLRVMVALALHRECGSASGSEADKEPYRHRIPLGLLMLSRGSITRDQLTHAIQAQKTAGEGRLGEWLIAGGTSEMAVANSLALQWGVPVLAIGREPEHARRLLPRFVVEISGVVPVRIAGGKILYLAVDEQVDRRVNEAIESMTGYRVEAGVMRSSEYAALRRELPEDAQIPARLFGPASMERMMGCIEGLISAGDAVSARLVRIRDYIWLRMEGRACGQTFPRPGIVPVEDTIFALRAGT